MEVLVPLSLCTWRCSLVSSPCCKICDLKRALHHLRPIWSMERLQWLNRCGRATKWYDLMCLPLTIVFWSSSWSWVASSRSNAGVDGRSHLASHLGALVRQVTSYMVAARRQPGNMWGWISFGSRAVAPGVGHIVILTVGDIVWVPFCHFGHEDGKMNPAPLVVGELMSAAWI
jgi:hypothetical protein